MEMEDGTSRRVFFVDDEPKVCTVVRKTLERAGISVSCCSSARACLAQLENAKSDLLVTDVRMKGMDGIELLVEVKKRFPWLPVLVVTGYGDVPMAVKALRAGAADFIEKPLDRDAFLDTVRGLLRRNSAQTSLFNHYLTKTEMRVLHFVLEGKNNREIAALLHRSPRTVEVHRSHMMQKMGAANVVELLRRAVDVGLLGMNMSPQEDGAA
jgi:two-component system response regulator FixJ